MGILYFTTISVLFIYLRQIIWKKHDCWTFVGPCSWVCTGKLHTAVLKVLMGVLSTDTLLYNRISSCYLLKSDYLEKTLLLDFCGCLLLGLHRYTPHRYLYL